MLMLRSSLAAALLLVTLAGSANADGEAPRNFVVIFADDLGAGEFGCYGHPQHETPNLDRLAREGMRFSMCWATPLCTPSRVTLLTGQYPHRHGYFQLLGRRYTPRPGSPLHEIRDKDTFASLLNAHGYVTALAGKWQLTGKLPDLVTECGFDEYRIWAYRQYLPRGVKHDGEWEDARERVTSRYWHPCVLENGALLPTGHEDYGPDLYTDFLVDFLRRHRSERMLLYYPMCLTHRPWAPTPDEERPGQRGKGGLARNVAHLDRVVGRLVKALDEAGLREETVVVFTADNGTQGRGKGKLTENGVRVPLIASCPGTIPKGVTSEALVSIADVMPTILEWAGVSPSLGHEIDGKSLVPVLTGETEAHRPWIVSFFEDRKMIRDERWLIDGRGKFYDTLKRRGGGRYGDVSASKEEEVVKARARLQAHLDALPGPEAVQEHLRLPDASGR